MRQPELSGGSVYLFRQCSTKAERWIKRHINLDEAIHLADGIAVERQYVDPIIEGAIATGLRVGRG